ncbi:MAG: tyrosine--tRNA ligase [Actinomycetota bacterium]|nr:tyrosine--tRNA ligase [Actinomycetota bacterium]
MSTPDLSRLVFGAHEVLSEEELQRKLALGRPLRVKLGIDPSRPDLHLGHTVVLRKLRAFQDQGHTAVLIIGDYTGLVGDPSGQSETRPMLSPEEMAENARTYFEQAGLVLDVERAEIRRNSEWLSPLTMADVLKLTSHMTVARLLEREDFRTRYQEGRPISLVEFLYPMMQAYDSVAVRADVELGGTDQTFNLLVGREIQRAYGQEPQVVMTMPLLEGTDGVRKMSKSFDNYVGITESPEEMFGKLMSVPDELIVRYLELCTDAGPEEVEAVRAGLGSGDRHPAEEKRRMARQIVALYHGAAAAEAAEARFNRVFRDQELPEDVAEAPLPAEVLRDGKVSLPHLLATLGLAESNSAARRFLDQRGVRRDGEILDGVGQEVDPEFVIGHVLSVGRRAFVRILPPQAS